MPLRRTCHGRSRDILFSPVSDLTGNLEPRRRWKGTTTPAQSQLNRARQAELVICDKAIERTHAWFNRFRRLPIRYEHRADIYQAFTSLAASLITLNQIKRFC
jgi:transposase